MCSSDLGPWQTDAAALDGVLQLALIWGARALDGPSLPTGIGQIRILREGPWPSPTRSFPRGQKQGQSPALATCQLTTPPHGKPAGRAQR